MHLDKKEKESRWFPKIENMDEAKNVLNKNGIVGYIFCGMYVLGLILLLILNKNVALNQNISSEDMIFHVVGMTVIIAICLFFSWRMHKKNGIISATILLLFFCWEIYEKVLAGTTNVGWFLFYAILFLGFFNSIRAIRFIKMQERIELKTSKVETNG